MVMTANLPAAVLTTITTGQYKSWTLGRERELVFKDKESDKLKVYKVSVKMGMEKHVLFIDPNGKLINDKKLS